MDIQGNIIVAEQGNSRIQVLSPDGKYINDFRILDGWISGLQAVSKEDDIVLSIPMKTSSSRKLLFI